MSGPSNPRSACLRSVKPGHARSCCQARCCASLGAKIAAGGTALPLVQKLSEMRSKHFGKSAWTCGDSVVSDEGAPVSGSSTAARVARAMQPRSTHTSTP
eukprot:2452289-Pleurochrysis_carterae.AAC.2